MKNSFLLIFLSLCCLSCSHASSSDSDSSQTLDIESSYCTEAELAGREGPFSLIEKPSDWLFQYPSGSEEKGMISQTIPSSFKSKYLSAYKDSDSKNYLRFSLDASDKGKSKNGSSVRAELRHSKEWTLLDKTSLSYTFYVTSTDLQRAKFTVGQFLQHCSQKDSPLCRIEVENGKIFAVVVNYESDGKTKADGKSYRYDLGFISQKQEVSIKIAVENKILTLYRDGNKIQEHIFHQNVSSAFKNYYKIGIYYQNKDSPNIFSEVFVRNLKVEV
ncbi:MAG: polysaccharide lyase family 7 protein [Treponema sp.]|nr:polysaccharide lyase family 7 protein [Treponema sp.]